MSEIAILTEQIMALEPIIAEEKGYQGLLFAGLFIGFIAGFVITMIFAPEKKHPMFSIGLTLLGIAILSTVLLFDHISSGTAYSKQHDLMEQRSQEVKNEIIKMNCEQIRLDILNKLEVESIPDYMREHDEFQKELYYHKCEVPLRDEIRRLGELGN